MVTEEREDDEGMTEEELDDRVGNMLYEDENFVVKTKATVKQRAKSQIKSS
jgi:hypothetical protein